METTETTHRGSFFGLLGHWRHEVMRLIQEEVKLAKTEIMEKVSKMMRNAIYAAAGGVVALIGAELLFLGIGVVAGYGLTKLGWDTGLSYAVGIGGMGIIVALIGAAFLMKGIKAFNAKSLAPHQTIDTMRELTGKHPEPKVEVKDKKARKHNGDHRESSEELRRRFEQTRAEVQRTMEELRQRTHLGAAVARNVHSHPMRTLAAGLATGYLGGRILKNRISGGTERRTERLQKRVARLESERPMSRKIFGLFTKH
ncbi:MAG: phage holin family protein [Limisphaerales bacterium]